MISFKKYNYIKEYIEKRTVRIDSDNLETELDAFIKKHKDVWFDVDGTLIDAKNKKLTKLGKIMLQKNLNLKIITMNGIWNKKNLGKYGFKIKQLITPKQIEDENFFDIDNINLQMSKTVPNLVDNEEHPLVKNILKVV